MEQFTVRSVDYHTGGEPFRIVTDVPPLRAATVADKRVEAIGDPAVDSLRRLLCYEPRGHADMYGGFIVPADDGCGLRERAQVAAPSSSIQPIHLVRGSSCADARVRPARPSMEK